MIPFEGTKSKKLVPVVTVEEVLVIVELVMVVICARLTLLISWFHTSCPIYSFLSQSPTVHQVSSLIYG